MFGKRPIVLAAGMLALAALLPGCYDDPGGYYTETPASASYGYVPAYYDGYPVYYDTVGNPYYYNGGTSIWIGAGSPYYPGLREHWRVYGSGYGRWNAAYGARYRGYRVAPGYYGVHGGYGRGYVHGGYRGGGYHGGYHGGMSHGGMSHGGGGHHR